MLHDENGKIKNIPCRYDVVKLKPNQLKFFYENFIIRCENDIKPLKYFFINSREIKQLKKELNFELKPLASSQIASVTTSLNEFVYLNDKRSAIASLLFHMRNVFVHNRIRILDSGEIELFDVILPPHMSKKDITRLKKQGRQRPKARITLRTG